MITSRDAARAAHVHHIRINETGSFSARKQHVFLEVIFIAMINITSRANARESLAAAACAPFGVRQRFFAKKKIFKILRSGHDRN